MTEQQINPIIHLTQNASNRVKRHLQKRGSGIGIRVGVKTTGCSGYTYVLEFVDNLMENDTAIEVDTFKVVIDKQHIPYVQGMTLDFIRNGLNEGFSFLNPNERDRCGCGESFRV